MPKFPVDNERQLYRFFGLEMSTGYQFTNSKAENKKLAKYLRSHGIPAKSIILPETHGMNYGMQAPERYCVYIPVKTVRDNKGIDNLIFKFYNELVHNELEGKTDDRLST